MWHDVRALNTTTNVLMGLLVLGLLACGAWWFAQRPMFTIRVITIQGADHGELRHVSASTVKNAAIPRIKGNFFTANLDTVRQAFEMVPWVRKATVRREWPNQLIVTLEEHQPLGTWGDDGRLLSVKGDVFTANLAEAEEDGDLVEFSGPDGSEKDVVARYHDLQEWFSAAKLEPESVQLSNRYAWSVRLDNGMTVELGREENSSTLQDRVKRLVGVYSELAARLQGKIESVDMRYPNGLALRVHGLAFGLDSKKQ
jgi:cell division protein FtsQ